MYLLKLSPEKKIEVYYLMLLYFLWSRNGSRRVTSYTEVRVGCSSSCLRVEIADCSLSEGVKDGKTNMFLPQKV